MCEVETGGKPELDHIFCSSSGLTSQIRTRRTTIEPSHVKMSPSRGPALHCDGVVSLDRSVSSFCSRRNAMILLWISICEPNPDCSARFWMKVVLSDNHIHCSRQTFHVGCRTRRQARTLVRTVFCSGVDVRSIVHSHDEVENTCFAK